MPISRYRTNGAPWKSGGIARPRLPAVAALAALGPLVCLSRARDPSVQAGWHRAVACEYTAHLDSNGLRECLRFRDADGHCCWCLYALPEDDFLAWERLIAVVPQGALNDETVSVVERLWHGVADALQGRRWRAGVIGIHPVACMSGIPSDEMAIGEPGLAAFSWDIARYIAEDVGAAWRPGGSLQWPSGGVGRNGVSGPCTSASPDDQWGAGCTT